ncbi:zf-TFIIB domain-containing protein [Agriterribacter sp.]|uniref:TFIIB-type zinc ribbon-containing protein n=1 Tax=Agriterribacter sp. TaxID=2821509 RepID=UPI002D1698EB|nr:zf-TFIIB domain-containing protein [Agriterribacter sp.]HTN08236.1 zf-TFIIB domain-containing protein [Agriterribacter sp.]
MKCPTCNETLLISDKNGIEIDYCPKCRGIWLDRGELDKIIDRSAEHYSRKENYDRDVNQYGHKDNDAGYYKKNPHYKKKSFLGDIFDF